LIRTTLSMLAVLAASTAGLARPSLSAFAQQSAQGTAAEVTPWPPLGVYTPGEAGVSLPRVLSRIEPQYTGDAMRARIQGLVAVAVVVSPDGTVGAIRVVRSLDRLHGLDDQAIAAVKKWRFVPAMKDGAAVPAVVAVEVGFSIRGLPPSLTWPEPFSTSDETLGYSTTWTEEAAETTALGIRASYPQGWSASRNGPRGKVLVLRNTDGTRSVGIDTPRPITTTLDQPLTVPRLEGFADRMKESTAALRNAESLGVGQLQIDGRLWVWVGVKVPTLDVPGLAPELNAALQATFDGARLWIFSAVVRNQLVSVYCLAITPRNTPAEQAEGLRQAGAEFGAILRRISIR
jgi:TonB family protein